MSTRASWLAEVLGKAGCTVVAVPGWEDRGRAVAGFYAVVAHATATGPNAKDQNVANLLRDGHSTLAGPLCQLGLDRHGRYWLIASGKGNHNGYGLHGNNSIGIEAFNDNLSEPWPNVQVDAYVKGAAAILDHLNLPTARFLAHKETDAGRKTDVKLDMNRLRQRVDAHRNQEDDMTPEQAEWLGRLHHEVVADGARLDRLEDLLAQTRYESALTQQKLDKLLSR